MNKSGDNSPRGYMMARKQSMFSVFSNQEEERIISDATTTSYEKVLRILNNLKYELEEKNFEKSTILDIQWVITKIQSHTLYTYEISEENFSTDKFSIGNIQVKTYMDYLKDFSEVKEIHKRNRDAKTNKTSMIIKPQSKKKMTSTFTKSNCSVNFKKISDSNINLDEIIKKEEDEFDLKIINDIYFNIHSFEELVGTKNVFPFIAKFAYNTTSTMDLLNTEAMDNFLERSRDGYKLVPYHNSLHAADVTQNILIILTKTNCIELLHLSQIDIISLITACLLHDIGHPSTNNMYQINTSSDFAVTYNDKSVLESFHVAEAFRILKKVEANIFSKFDKMQFRNIRKRMIELILATDMMYHAKTLSLVKNKITSYNVLGGKNIEDIFTENSNTFFDEQQEILNFLIHTCDIGHSAKLFDLSYKWTYCIMEEFWNQGDLEKKLNIPVSFLCDRDNADVPRNQIAFIKSILCPNFDVLIELFPSLIHFKFNLENNVTSWQNIMEKEKEEKEKKKE